MFYGNNRNDIRQIYFGAWQAARTGKPLEPLQQQIVEVIQIHPEYQNFLGNMDNIDQDFSPEQGQSNPFLHMGMHMAIKEQLSVNQPMGIKGVYKKLLEKHPDPHAVEHQIMESLAEILWQAQSNQTEPDMAKYLEKLRKLCE